MFRRNQNTMNSTNYDDSYDRRDSRSSFFRGDNTDATRHHGKWTSGSTVTDFDNSPRDSTPSDWSVNVDWRNTGNMDRGYYPQAYGNPHMYDRDWNTTSFGQSDRDWNNYGMRRGMGMGMGGMSSMNRGMCYNCNCMKGMGNCGNCVGMRGMRGTEMCYNCNCMKGMGSCGSCTSMKGMRGTEMCYNCNCMRGMGSCGSCTGMKGMSGMTGMRGTEMCYNCNCMKGMGSCGSCTSMKGMNGMGMCYQCNCMKGMGSCGNCTSLKGMSGMNMCRNCNCMKGMGSCGSCTGMKGMTGMTGMSGMKMCKKCNCMKGMGSCQSCCSMKMMRKSEPCVDICENKMEYCIEMDLPGCTRDMVDVKVFGTELVITAQACHSMNSNRNMLLCERYCGEKCRRLNLPTDCDANGVRAELDCGVLKVTVPKMAGMNATWNNMKNSSGMNTGMNMNTTTNTTTTTY